MTSATPLPAATRSQPARSRRFALLAALYVSQAIPLGFFIEAVPAIGRDLGLARSDIGLIQALALPFLLKFLWAPLVDRLGSSRLGHYRSWLLPLQGLAMASVIAIAWLDPVRQMDWLIPLAGLFLLLAATQDIASDGLAVRILGLAERGVGNGIQVGGFYLGQIVGGGLTLVLYAAFGWRMALMAMALFMALPLVNLAGFKEPTVGAKPAAKIGLGTLGRFLRRSGNGPWIAVLVLYRAGDAMALTMAKPLFVDLGLSLTDIGLIVGLGNSAAALIGALIGGAAIERLGRRRALGGFAVLHALALTGFVLPATGYASLPTLWLVSALAAGAGGMATAALYTCMMDRTAAATAGTDFTLQQSLAAAGPLFGAALSGFSAEALGYPLHFVICALVSLAVALWVMTRVSFRTV